MKNKTKSFVYECQICKERFFDRKEAREHVMHKDNQHSETYKKRNNMIEGNLKKEGAMKLIKREEIKWELNAQDVKKKRK